MRAAAEPSRVSSAVIARDGRRERVVDCSPRAAASGVRRGMSVPSARAVSAEIVVLPLDRAAERRTLEGLAAALFRFTPDVAVDGPHALLLETGRTAARFGGEAALVRTLCAFVGGAGFTVAVGVAAHPGTARCLARAATSLRAPPTETSGAGRGAAVADSGGAVLRAGGDALRAIAPLPWSCLEPDAAAADACRALGLRTIGDVFALPRTALPSRFGDAFVAALAAAAGETTEVVVRFTPPAGFAERLELWSPVEEAAPLLFAATRLFAAAESALDARESGATEARLRFERIGAEPVVISLRPSEPARRAAVFVRLLQHRLERLSLDAPTEALELYIPPEAWVRIHPTAPDLFSPCATSASEAAEFRDRLATRLGAERVLTAVVCADHRPERAYRFRPHGARAGGATATERPVGTSSTGATATQAAEVAAPPGGRRPLELFSPPEEIEIAVDADGAPYGYVDPVGRRGTLRVIRGPERIAAGWWDGEDADRAYFEVETAAGFRWWLFHDLAAGGWRRHGAFS